VGSSCMIRRAIEALHVSIKSDTATSLEKTGNIFFGLSGLLRSPICRATVSDPETLRNGRSNASLDQVDRYGSIFIDLLFALPHLTVTVFQNRYDTLQIDKNEKF
jgi:hypothetical protein